MSIRVTVGHLPSGVDAPEVIRATVDLIPYGIGTSEVIGLLEIGNRQATGDLCDYDYRFGIMEADGVTANFEPWLIVRQHDRTTGVWHLIAQILDRRQQGPEEASDYLDE